MYEAVSSPLTQSRVQVRQRFLRISTYGRKPVLTRWTVAAVISLAVVLVILFVLGRKTLHAEIAIEAAPEEVCSVPTPVMRLGTRCSFRSVARSARARRSSTE